MARPYRVQRKDGSIIGYFTNKDFAFEAAEESALAGESAEVFSVRDGIYLGGYEPSGAVLGAVVFR